MRKASNRMTSSWRGCCSKAAEGAVKRGPWTAEEDEILVKFIEKEGEGKWRTLPKRAGLRRCGKSCRLRWMNYLRPSVKRGHISPDEEDLILRLHRLLGNRWSLIAGRIPGRTDNEIKNYWNTHLSKKLLRQGIDPRTHKPLHDANKNKTPSCGHDHHHHHLQLPIPSMSTTTFNVQDEANNNFDHDSLSLGEDCREHDHLDHQIQNRISHSDYDDDFDFCYDDTFSSFLDSLINEDPFGNSSQQPIQVHECLDDIVQGNVTSMGCDDPMAVSKDD